MEDLFQVGVITAPHGVRGEVKVFPTTDDNARFKNLKTVLLDQGRGTRELEIEGVKFFKNMVILKFKGIDDRNDVERMRQAKLLLCGRGTIIWPHGALPMARISLRAMMRWARYGVEQASLTI